MDIRIDEQIKKIEGVIEKQTECLKCLFFFSFLTVPRFSILFFFFPLIPCPSFPLPSSTLSPASFTHSALQALTRPRGLKQPRAVQDDASIPDQGLEGEAPSPSPSDSPAVTVPVSPSDVLTMFFQAEGTLTESAIPAVTEALEQTEGITGLKVQVVEGIASVELTKQTTIQSTGVASSLIETIQGAGFKLQTLNLSFEDKEEVFV